MGKLTGTRHGDAANDLFSFYQGKAKKLTESRQYFMAAVALAFAVETAMLAYLLVEFGDDNGGELKIPDSVSMSDLIEAANDIGVLNAPIDIPSHIRHDKRRPKHIAKDVVDNIRKFRNLIHPANALRKSFDPRTFKRKQLREYEEIYESILHSLMYYL